MAKAVSLGFLTPSPESAAVTNYSFRVGEVEAGHASDRSVPWDYATPVSTYFEVNVDQDRFFEESGFVDAQGNIDEDVVVVLHLSWFCTKTKQRGGSEPKILEHGRNRLQLTLPGPLLGGTLKVKAAATLRRASERTADPLAATAPGTRLWESGPYELTLEGAGPRFTMAPVDFKATQTHPERAQWLIHISSDLHLPASAGIRVLVNIGDAATRKMLENPTTAEAKIWRRSLETEVVAQMLVHATMLVDPIDLDQQFDEGSVGESLRNILDLLFPNESPADLAMAPSRLFAQAQHFVYGRKRDK